MDRWRDVDVPEELVAGGYRYLVLSRWEGSGSADRATTPERWQMLHDYYERRRSQASRWAPLAYDYAFTHVSHDFDPPADVMEEGNGAYAEIG